MDKKSFYYCLFLIIFWFLVVIGPASAGIITDMSEGKYQVEPGMQRLSAPDLTTFNPSHVNFLNEEQKSKHAMLRTEKNIAGYSSRSLSESTAELTSTIIPASTPVFGQYKKSLEISGTEDNYMGNPKGISIGSDGYLRITTTYDVAVNNHRIQKFSPDGTFLSDFGRRGDGNGEFEYPAGNDENPGNGDIYVADRNNNRIQYFSSEGIYKGQWDVILPNPTNPANPITNTEPGDVAISSDGHVYVLDTYLDVVIKYGLTGGPILALWGSDYPYNQHTTVDGKFDYPVGIAVDNYGYVYVADEMNYRIQKFSPDGTYISKTILTLETGHGYTPMAQGVDFSPSGNMFVDGNNYLYRYSESGDLIEYWEPERGNVYGGRIDIAVDSTGNVYETGSFNKVIKYSRVIPTITSIDPSSAPNTGPVSITSLSGTNFAGGATVHLARTGQTNIEATDVTVVSSSKITCTFPITGKTTGTWNVVVTSGGQTATKVNGFTISEATKPVITKITPNSGYNSGSITATITGTNFRTGANVKLTKGSVTKVATVKKITNTRITCTLPLTRAPAGRYNLIVTNTDRTSGKKLSAFTVKAAGSKPTITVIKPNAGLSSKNTVVTIIGKNFRAGVVVHMIKGSAVKKATIKNRSSTKIVCIFPTNRAATGLWNVKITNFDGTTATKVRGFLVKRTTSATHEVEAGQMNGIVLNTHVSDHLSAAPSQGSTLSTGVVVPINAPVVNQGVSAI